MWHAIMSEDVQGSLIFRAKAWVDAEPYIEAGVYRKVVVKPFERELP